MTDQLVAPAPDLPAPDLPAPDPDGLDLHRPTTLPELREHALTLARELPGRLGRIRVAAADLAVEIEWAAPAPVAVAAAPAAPAVPATAPVTVPAPAPVDDAAPAEPGGAPAPAHVVTAPLVGTFYSCSAPGEPPFVAVGDVVRAGQQLAIVEAMKLMNPVLADRAGRVRTVRVADGEMVEFDQVLVELDPADGEG